MPIDMNNAREVYRDGASGEAAKKANSPKSKLPVLEPYQGIGVGVGSSGAKMAHSTHAAMAAMGRPLASLGVLDGPAPDAPPPVFIIKPGFASPEGRIHQLTERNLEELARKQLPMDVREDLSIGHPFVETVAVERGLSGDRGLGPKAATAEERPLTTFLHELVTPFTPRQADGLDRFIQSGERRRLLAFVFLTLAGAVGSGMGIELCYRLSEIASLNSLDLDLHLVVLGARFFGAGTAKPLQPYLETNEQAAWDEIREATEKGFVRVGHRMIELDRPLFGPGHITVFGEAPVDSRTGEVTPELQAKYIDYVGLTMATAILSGALDSAQALENPTAKPDHLVRTMRLAGYGLDRWAVASALSNSAERRVLARWQEILEPTAS